MSADGGRGQPREGAIFGVNLSLGAYSNKLARLVEVNFSDICLGAKYDVPYFYMYPNISLAGFSHTEETKLRMKLAKARRRESRSKQHLTRAAAVLAPTLDNVVSQKVFGLDVRYRTTNKVTVDASTLDIQVAQKQEMQQLRLSEWGWTI